MRLLYFCVAAVVMTSAGARGQDAAQPGQSDADKPDRVVCKEVVVTGSLLPGPRICHTKAEWDEIQRQSEWELRKVQDANGATHGG